MDYATFKRLETKPSGMSSRATDSPLDFSSDADSLLALLDDFSSFEDLQSDIGIESSWADDFRKVFPSFEPIASADFGSVEDPDSYSEFLLLIDTAQPNNPVFYFSAESWRWDDWEKNPDKGFRKVSPSFAEFYDSLSEA